jgi:hypothetical protein
MFLDKNHLVIRPEISGSQTNLKRPRWEYFPADEVL